MQAAFPALVTGLALLLYIFTGIYVGRMRARHGVQAPSISGPPAFERAFRVQQNTLEQLVLFLPALWLFTLLVSAFWGGAIGIVWVVARVAYAVAYYRDAARRGPGFILAFACSLVLVVGALAGAVVNLR